MLPVFGNDVMAVFRFGHTWDAFRDLEREVDRLLGSMNFAIHGVRVGRAFPSVNFYEYEDRYLMTAELPGVRREELDLSIADGVLTLKGQRGNPDPVADNDYRRAERPRGLWQRSLRLPERIEVDQLKAELNHGILKVTFPKAPESKPRQIPIQGGGE